MDDFGNTILNDYWCPKCKSWQLFQFEFYNYCDVCALDGLFSDESMKVLDEALERFFELDESAYRAGLVPA